MSENVYASIRVMAIDDEEFSRKFLTKVLNKIGVEKVVFAENGVDALAKLEKLEHPLDLIICDIEMPEMDGYELARKLRYGIVPRFKEIPIVMLTGKDTDKNIRSGRIHKIDGFMVKPPEIEPMRKMIDKVIARK